MKLRTSDFRLSPAQVVVIACALVAGGSIATGVGVQPPDTATVVERASRYVDAYEQAFSAIVSEEQQTQKVVDKNGRVKKTRRLTSDFLMVKLEPGWPVVFRDVLEVDGKPVRNRADRLRKLFLEKPRTAVEQANAIAMESRRHNIGPNRTGNSPFLPLVFLSPKITPRSHFNLTGSTLTFEEFGIPTIMARRVAKTRFNIFASGSFDLDLETGRVLGASVSGAGTTRDYGIDLTVKYRRDPQLDLMVPVDVQERYARHGKPNDDRIEATSTYSNFRRFQVTVGEQIKVPKE